MRTRTITDVVFRAASAALIVLTVIGCKKDNASEESTTETPEPLAPVSAVIEVEARPTTPAVTIQIELPGGWHAHDFFDATWLPGDDPFEVSVDADAGCGGACAADQIPGNIVNEVERDLQARWSQGSDEPHFQATVEMLDSGELPLGRYQAYRLSYPPAPDGEAAAMPGTHLECYLNNPGDAFYVVLDATARPNDEAQIWPALLESCRGASYAVAE